MLSVDSIGNFRISSGNFQQTGNRNSGNVRMPISESSVMTPKPLLSPGKLGSNPGITVIKLFSFVADDEAK
jgi:hypothetical protein